MTAVTRSGLTGFFFPKKNQSSPVPGGPSSKKPQSGPVPGGSSSKKTQSGQVPGGHPRSTGTGDRHRTRSAFWTSQNVTMGVGDDGDEDWNSESVEDDGDCEGRDDDVELIETPSPAADSAEPMFHFPERSEDNTAWLFPEGIKSV